jgi:hypothetical protein
MGLKAGPNHFFVVSAMQKPRSRTQKEKACKIYITPESSRLRALGIKGKVWVGLA